MTAFDSNDALGAPSWLALVLFKPLGTNASAPCGFSNYSSPKKKQLYLPSRVVTPPPPFGFFAPIPLHLLINLPKILSGKSTTGYFLQMARRNLCPPFLRIALSFLCFFFLRWLKFQSHSNSTDLQRRSPLREEDTTFFYPLALPFDYPPLSLPTP